MVAATIRKMHAPNHEAAVNEGMRKIDEMTEAEMGKLTGGMKMPGMF